MRDFAVADLHESNRLPKLLGRKGGDGLRASVLAHAVSGRGSTPAKARMRCRPA